MYAIIVSSVYCFIVVVGEMVLLTVNGILAEKNFKGYVIFKRVFRYTILIAFTSFNFLFSFAKPEYVYQLVLQIIGNIAALIYFFLDLLYFTPRTRSYIRWLQKIVFSEAPLKDVFKVEIDTGTWFQEIRKVPQQLYSLVRVGNDESLSIRIPLEKGSLLLKPIEPMDEETLMFYAQKIEFYGEEDGELKFHKGAIPVEAIKEFEYGEDSKFYLWIRNKLLSIKGKKVAQWSFLITVVLVAIISMLFNLLFGYDVINEWLRSKL